MAEENKTVNKQKIDINTYRFPSGQTIDEILKTQTSWSTDEQCLLNMIDSNWRAVDYFITDKEKELSKKFLLASNNPEVDLKLLAVQSEVATQYLCQKHTNQELWEKARNDPKGMTRPFSKDVVNIENQILIRRADLGMSQAVVALINHFRFLPGIQNHQAIVFIGQMIAAGNASGIGGCQVTRDLTALGEIAHLGHFSGVQVDREYFGFIPDGIADILFTIRGETAESVIGDAGELTGFDICAVAAAILLSG